MPWPRIAATLQPLKGVGPETGGMAVVEEIEVTDGLSTVIGMGWGTVFRDIEERYDPCERK
ncbi:hypothetical protein AA12717_2898 [Gluconacetobacter sacchari DSM 12717]|uniref:Uncharacterized protein n=1 Tax=Gluconacetobacter sacchari DSM 12717 TaxID=1307940 RepID=A0ABQ0P9U6_9PROT|nr:hypothetical protein AA12717_2898 [Gluconacetobacter sacchari DSM 12717]